MVGWCIVIRLAKVEGAIELTFPACFISHLHHHQVATAASSKPLASVSETASRAWSSAALPYSGNLQTPTTSTRSCPLSSLLSPLFFPFLFSHCPPPAIGHRPVQPVALRNLVAESRTDKNNVGKQHCMSARSESQSWTSIVSRWVGRDRRVLKQEAAVGSVAAPRPSRWISNRCWLPEYPYRVVRKTRRVTR